MQERLKEKDVPAEIASLEFVRDLVTAVPTSANVKYYAQIVADKSVMRKMIKLNEEIENMCYAGNNNQLCACSYFTADDTTCRTSH